MTSKTSLDDLLRAARRWADQDPDPVTKEELQALVASAEPKVLREHFGSRLQFGTAGLRGVLGPGPNRMNRALVRRVGAGLGNYLLAEAPDAAERGVVVGGDARHKSDEFVEDTARVLAGLGLTVWIFDEPVATPVLAYVVRELKAAAGVIVTASHNPPEYNGYKVYWDNGAQIVPPHDGGISRAIDAVDSITDLEMPELDALREANRVRPVGAAPLDAYFERIAAQRRHPEVTLDVDVVYTPMHGVGGQPVRRALGEAGLRQLHLVPEQAEPDGDFPTVRFPNPEEPGAMDLALSLARQKRADVVLANDPDADRLAVAIADEDEDEGYRMLSGNEIGSLLAYYLLTEGDVPVRPLVMTTIVSSRLLSVMAGELGAHYDETLTGFKWIANRAQEHHREQGWNFVMGYEEALGYTVGDVVADKDGVSAALLFVEMAAVCRERDRTLGDYLGELNRRFGLYESLQHSLTLPGQEGQAKIEAIMQGLRAQPPTHIGERIVERVTDYAPGVEGLPPSNVLAFALQGGGRVLVRPSGTEPKIKFYFELSQAIGEGEGLRHQREHLREQLTQLAQTWLNSLEGAS